MRKNQQVQSSNYDEVREINVVGFEYENQIPDSEKEPILKE